MSQQLCIWRQMGLAETLPTLQCTYTCLGVHFVLQTVLRTGVVIPPGCKYLAKNNYVCHAEHVCVNMQRESAVVWWAWLGGREQLHSQR